MKQFEDYGNPNENKVSAMVLIDILNCLERIEKELRASQNEPKATPQKPNPAWDKPQRRY